MNNKKIHNILVGVNLLKSNKEKNIPTKKNIESAININTYKTGKKNINKTSSNKNKFINNKNSFNKNQNRKQTLSSINNVKSSKVFEVKNKKNKIKFSLNLNEESSFSQNKYKSDKNFYNTINAINTRVKIFNKNDFIIKDFNKKNKSIQNSSRVKVNHIRYNTYSNNYNGSREEFNYKNKNNKKDDKIKQSNNIIINFFNAPINKYNEEFYFNNINDMNKIIIKNKPIKKKVLNIFNHLNRKSSHNDNLNNNNIKNIYPIFSSHSNINNYNNFELQIYQNKKKTISNVFDNLKTIVNSHSITKVKSPNYKESIDIYSNRYKRIKFNKNRKNTKNLSLNIKLKGENKLKTIFKRTNNYYNLNTLNKNNLLNIKKEHYIRSKNLKTENKIKSKHVLYNLLFKSSLKTEKNKSSKTKSKNLKDILSFNKLNIFKSIDVEKSFKSNNKFNTIITEVHNNKTKKTIKNKFLKKSSVPLKINTNLHYHQKKNNMKSILNNNNKATIKFNPKEDGNNKSLKTKFDEHNNSSENQIIINKDPKYLGEYLDEILCNLYLEEKKFMEKIGFQISSDILNNYGINPETRTCLIDSLIDLQKIFDFNERTLFITVQLFDRYIALSVIKDIKPKLKEENLDIILTASLLIASKLEESVLYKLSDYLGILSEKYTLEDIKITENKIMNLLDFSAVSPTILDFFEVFAEKIQLNDDKKKRGLFLLNTILLDINLSQISGSVIAYAIIIILQDNNIDKCKNLIEILNLMTKNYYKNKLENSESLCLMNNDEKMGELCHLIQIFAEGILKTEYNHVSEKFNCNKNDCITKLNKYSSI